MDYNNSRLYQVQKTIQLMTQPSDRRTGGYKYQAIFISLPNSKSYSQSTTRYFQVRQENNLYRKLKMKRSTNRIRPAESALPPIAINDGIQLCAPNLTFEPSDRLPHNQPQLNHRLAGKRSQSYNTIKRGVEHNVEHNGAELNKRASIQRLHQKMRNERKVQSCIERYRSSVAPEDGSLLFTKTQLHPRNSAPELQFLTIDNGSKAEKSTAEPPNAHDLEVKVTVLPAPENSAIELPETQGDCKIFTEERSPTEQASTNTADESAQSTNATTVFLTDLPNGDIELKENESFAPPSSYNNQNKTSMQKQFMLITGYGDHAPLRPEEKPKADAKPASEQMSLPYTDLVEKMSRNKASGVDYVLAWLQYHNTLGYLHSKAYEEDLKEEYIINQSAIDSREKDRRRQFLPIKDLSTGSISSDTSHYTSRRQPWSSNSLPLSAKTIGNHSSTPTVVEPEPIRRPRQLSLQTRILNNTTKNRSSFTNHLLDLHIGVTERVRRSVPSLPSFSASIRRKETQHSSNLSRPKSDRLTVRFKEQHDTNLRMDSEDSSFINFVKLNRSTSERLRKNLFDLD